MNCVFIIPTGINCSIGGHAGDASPFFNMIAGMCDTIITNPNTLNASDICEIPKNCMYVEGSILDDFLDGNISFKKKNNHRVLVLVENRDKVSINIAVNTAQAAMCNLGIDIVDVRLFKPIFMKGWVHEKRAWGDIRNLNNILDICYKDTDKYDCVAITSYINRQDSLKEKYNKSRGEIPNPWGAVEAMLSKELSVKLGKMVVHSPMYEEDNDIITDPRISAEAISRGFFYCLFKGLKHAPEITYNPLEGLHVKDVDAIIIPNGVPHREIKHASFLYKNLVIEVEENLNCYGKTSVSHEYKKCVKAKNYMEVCGILSCLKQGISLKSLKRPLDKLKIKSR